MPAESEIVTPFLCRSRRPIAMNDADIEVLLLVKQHHRLCKNGIEAPLGFKAPKSGVDPGVMNFRLPRFVLLDGQLLPLDSRCTTVSKYS